MRLTIQFGSKKSRDVLRHENWGFVAHLPHHLEIESGVDDCKLDCNEPKRLQDSYGTSRKAQLGKSIGPMSVLHPRDQDVFWKPSSMRRLTMADSQMDQISDDEGILAET